MTRRPLSSVSTFLPPSAPPVMIIASSGETVLYRLATTITMRMKMTDEDDGDDDAGAEEFEHGKRGMRDEA